MSEQVPVSVVRGVIDAWKQEATQRLKRTPSDTAAESLLSCASELESELTHALDAHRLLTVEEFARLRDVDGSTVRRWCVRGELPAEKNSAGDWMIPAHATRARSA